MYKLFEQERKVKGLREQEDEVMLKSKSYVEILKLIFR